MGAYCRCSHCERRKTLRKKPGEYVRQPQCPTCGRRRWRLDRWRAAHERGKRVTCWCHRAGLGGGFYWFPHRKGSKLCTHNPHLTPEIAEEAFEQLSARRACRA